jgi:hypothetical protein
MYRSRYCTTAPTNDVRVKITWPTRHVNIAFIDSEGLMPSRLDVRWARQRSEYGQHSHVNRSYCRASCNFAPTVSTPAHARPRTTRASRFILLGLHTTSPQMRRAADYRRALRRRPPDRRITYISEPISHRRSLGPARHTTLISR